MKFKELEKNVVELEIRGDGDESRSFCYIDDIVQGIILMSDLGLDREIYHIGNDYEIKIKDLISLIAKHMGVKIIIKKLSAFDGSTKRRCPNIEKMRNLGFVPRVDLNKGLQNTINWYVQNNKSEESNDLI
jgi:UDP-glucose 4-epimerase